MTDCIDHGQMVGKFTYGKKTIRGKSLGLHVWAYCTHHGLDPFSLKGTGQVIRHKCDNPRCINPHHLEVGTHEDNMDDMVSRGRSTAGSKHGRAVLDEVTVAHIKELLINRVPQREVARRYGVSQCTIGKIGRGELWKHVA